MDTWLQQDGASRHYTVIVRECLYEAFPDSWTGRRSILKGPPARSPDMNIMYFFMGPFQKCCS